MADFTEPFLRWLFYIIISVTGLTRRENTVLIQKYNIHLLFKVLLNTFLGADVQINPVSVGKLHKPAVAGFLVAVAVIAVFIGVLHKKPLAEAVYPKLILNKRCRAVYDIYDIIVHENISRRIRVCARAADICRAYSVIIFRCIYYQLVHLFFTSHGFHLYPRYHLNSRGQI